MKLKVNESWNGINHALTYGFRGIPGNDSLSRLLDRNGRKQNPKNLPIIIEKNVFKAADKYYKQTGKWPTRRTNESTNGARTEHERGRKHVMGQ